MTIKVLLVFSLWFVYVQNSLSSEKYPVVNAPVGTFQGSVLTSRLGKIIYSFRGIRYAEAPVGELRFKVSFYYLIALLGV